MSADCKLECGREQACAAPAVDPAEYAEIFAQGMERIWHSNEGHCDWRGYNEQQIFEAVAGEFDEYREAVAAGQLRGRHGQLNELRDLLVTVMKGIRRLSCLK